MWHLSSPTKYVVLYIECIETDDELRLLVRGLLGEGHNLYSGGRLAGI
jgi:hypothetical protein